MSSIDWKEILGWGEEEVEDIRFVAFSYIKQGMYDIAIKFFEGLAVLTPPNVYDLQTLGTLHLQKGNGMEALLFLDKALEIEPEHYPTLLNRAKALFLLGYTKQGMLQAKELEKCPDAFIASQASALLLSHA